MKNKSFSINYNFCFFLRKLFLAKLAYKELCFVIESFQLFKPNTYFFLQRLENIFVKSQSKFEHIREIGLRLSSKQDLDLFDFSLRLYQIKDLLLAEAKIFEAVDLDKLSNLDPLSLEYDKISVLKPYKTRVSGALLSLLFFEKLDKSEFNFMSQDSLNFISDLSKKAAALKKKGLESNQIFMLMFSESINQSIISDSGTNYEDRIKAVLIKEGVKNITKTHDKNDKSTEYDWFFELDGRTYGIGAKRTLRERYKQFIKTALTSKIDVSIEVTIGLDLNKEKAKTIVSHGSYIFVADEIYQARKFLKEIKGVYSVRELNLKTLKKLGR